MKLLKVASAIGDDPRLELVDFIGDRIPPYAILSHCWAEDEVLYSDVTRHTAAQRKGFQKVRSAAIQAYSDGYKFIWIDTCCIDKSSSAELQESINSMYRYYEKAKTCYVHLADVFATPGSEGSGQRKAFEAEFTRSRWFTRGWTLQELLAPFDLLFISSKWERIGWKHESHLLKLAEATTGIEAIILSGETERTFRTESVATRMSWASHRQTTRVEDIAYSLMGLFDVNMPLLYGEGDKAFFRLQEEIMKQSQDHSIFAWCGGPKKDEFICRSLLAESPSWFSTTREIDLLDLEQAISDDMVYLDPYNMTNRGLHIQLQVQPLVDNFYLALLCCRFASARSGSGQLAIYLRKGPRKNSYYRAFCEHLVTIKERDHFKLETFYVPKSPLNEKALWSGRGAYRRARLRFHGASPTIKQLKIVSQDQVPGTENEVEVSIHFACVLAVLEDEHGAQEQIVIYCGLMGMLVGYNCYLDSLESAANDRTERSSVAEAGSVAADPCIINIPSIHANDESPKRLIMHLRELSSSLQPVGSPMHIPPASPRFIVSVEAIVMDYERPPPFQSDPTYTLEIRVASLTPTSLEDVPDRAPVKSQPPRRRFHIRYL